jgi:hypothetical protein
MYFINDDLISIAFPNARAIEMTASLAYSFKMRAVLHIVACRAVTRQ